MMKNEWSTEEIREIANKSGVPIWLVKEMITFSEEELREVIKCWDNYQAVKSDRVGTEKLGIGEKTIYRALTSYGYTMKELHQLHVKLGDIGKLGEFVVSHKKQSGMGDFF